MPRVLVTSDDGRVTLDEHVLTSDFAADHFRHCLVDRLSWATEDAEPQRTLDEERDRDRFTAD